MPEEIEFEEDARARWAQGDVTRAQRAIAQQLADKAQQQLHAQCSASVDPIVRAHYAHFLAMHTMVEMLGPGKKR